VTAMDDGPVTGHDLNDAAHTALGAHAAGRPCHTGCPGTADCRQLVWARRRHGLGGPQRPSWTCTVCPAGTPWPCPPARVALAERYAGDLIRLVVDLDAMMRTALDETNEGGAALYERFILWTRPLWRQSAPSQRDNGQCRSTDAPIPRRRPRWHRRRI
jgi:hypothetical protein